MIIGKLQRAQTEIFEKLEKQPSSKRLYGQVAAYSVGLAAIHTFVATLELASQFVIRPIPFVLGYGDDVATFLDVQNAAQKAFMNLQSAYFALYGAITSQNANWFLGKEASLGYVWQKENKKKVEEDKKKAEPINIEKINKEIENFNKKLTAEIKDENLVQTYLQLAAEKEMIDKQIASSNADKSKLTAFYSLERIKLKAELFVKVAVLEEVLQYNEMAKKIANHLEHSNLILRGDEKQDKVQYIERLYDTFINNQKIIAEDEKQLKHYSQKVVDLKTQVIELKLSDSLKDDLDKAATKTTVIEAQYVDLNNLFRGAVAIYNILVALNDVLKNKISVTDALSKTEAQYKILEPVHKQHIVTNEGELIAQEALFLLGELKKIEDKQLDKLQDKPFSPSTNTTPAVKHMVSIIKELKQEVEDKKQAALASINP